MKEQDGKYAIVQIKSRPNLCRPIHVKLIKLQTARSYMSKNRLILHQLSANPCMFHNHAWLKVPSAFIAPKLLFTGKLSALLTPSRDWMRLSPTVLTAYQ